MPGLAATTLDDANGSESATVGRLPVSAGTRQRLVGAFGKLGRYLTRRVDFPPFMVEALENDELIHEAPAIVGCQTPSALAHAGGASLRERSSRRRVP